MWSRLTIVLLLFITMLLTALVVRQHEVIRTFELRPLSYPQDRPFVEKALRYWAARNGLTVEETMKGEYSKTMEFANQICVSLVFETSDVGAVRVYCFDKRSAKLVSFYNGGE